MKTLSTEQQLDLQDLIQGLSNTGTDLSMDEKARLSYWAIELKPKRVRKKLAITDHGIDFVEAESNISLDNTPQV